ncbi:MAG: DNA translocase FtsK 4TM domain-containing protein [Deltaproteobacteria bacterium]|nr:DNA translocase FtsK 4TM domain-containing protein [Deltaproteobacteria bacterium]
MAKARAKKTEETSDLPVDDDGMMVVPSRGIEALGIGMLILALGLCFALFSFDPGDAAGRGNLVGPLGSGVARTILGGIGVAGYVVGLLGVALAGATLFGRVRLPSPLAAVSAASLMIGTCVLAQLVVGEPAVLGHPAGGALGLVLSELLRGVAGPAGAALFGVGLVLLGVIGISNLSFSLALCKRAFAPSASWARP